MKRKSPTSRWGFFVFDAELTQLPIEALVFTSWRAAVGGEAIPYTVGETAEAVYDRLAVT